jgi:hypothetical protein
MYYLTDPNVKPFTATGNTMKDHETGYEWKDGKLLDKKGRPFAFFHQWDRTEYRGEILTNNGSMRGTK